MNRYEREQQDRYLSRHRDDWLGVLGVEGLRTPDSTGTTWARWDAGGTVVMVRFGLRGTATLDVSWVDPDGARNGMLAPRDVEYIPWLARDVARLLATPAEGMRDLIPGLCKP